jgi:hypothetical protein
MTAGSFGFGNLASWSEFTWATTASSISAAGTLHTEHSA